MENLEFEFNTSKRHITTRHISIDATCNWTVTCHWKDLKHFSRCTIQKNFSFLSHLSLLATFGQLMVYNKSYVVKKFYKENGQTEFRERPLFSATTWFNLFLELLCSWRTIAVLQMGLIFMRFSFRRRSSLCSLSFEGTFATRISNIGIRSTH